MIPFPLLRRGLPPTSYRRIAVLGGLTATMLVVVASGFVLRYMLNYFSHEVKDKLLLLQTASDDLDAAWGVLERLPGEAKTLPKSRLLSAGFASVGIDLSADSNAAVDVTRLAESVADLEYAIRTHEFFERWFRRALIVHFVLSLSFYLLLVLHIWAGVHLGLRHQPRLPYRYQRINRSPWGAVTIASN